MAATACRQGNAQEMKCIGLYIQKQIEMGAHDMPYFGYCDHEIGVMCIYISNTSDS